MNFSKRKTQNAQRTTQYAFTLIELLFVILIIAVLTGLALFRTNIAGMTKTKLKDASQRMVGDLRYTRSLAITDADQYKLTIDQANNEYAIYDSGNNQVGQTKTVDSDITITGDTEFIFTLLGEADASAGEEFSLSAGGDEYDITVTTATGMVSMKED